MREVLIKIDSMRFIFRVPLAAASSVAKLRQEEEPSLIYHVGRTLRIVLLPREASLVFFKQVEKETKDEPNSKEHKGRMQSNSNS